MYYVCKYIIVCMNTSAVAIIFICDSIVATDVMCLTSGLRKDNPIYYLDNIERSYRSALILGFSVLYIQLRIKCRKCKWAESVCYESYLSCKPDFKNSQKCFESLTFLFKTSGVFAYNMCLFIKNSIIAKATQFNIKNV